jgi:two-component system, OmpR family, phosphate regulon sensor histidine kinase PhoR
MNKDYSILVVDDLVEIRYIITEMLKAEGYAVQDAENGVQALDKCSATAFDLFIIDIVMPEMDGLELLRRLNVFENTYEAVMITGDETLESAKKSMERGAFGYLSKSDIQDGLIALAAKAIGMVDMKRNRLVRFAAMEKKVADRSAELESIMRLLEYQGRQIDSIINSMGEGIIAVDNEQSIVLMNRPAEQLTGLCFADCAGSRFSSAFKSLGVADRLLSLMETGSTPSKEINTIPITQKDGRQKYYYVNMQHVTDEKGVRTGSVFLFLDQTESINAGRMRDSFFSIAAHELRTPISVNMNYLALLDCKCENDGEYKEIIRGMQTANRRLTVLVNRIISLAYLSNHSYTVHRTVTDVNRLVQSKILKLRPESDEKKVAIFVDNRLLETRLSVDPYLLKIELYNLLSNAIKFNRVGGSVRIVLEQNPGSVSDLLSIAIIDEGEGISDRARSGLFTSFSQGEDPLTRAQGGMGIGLYLVKKAVELMGGSVEVLSEKGKGSTFILKVPLS